MPLFMQAKLIVPTVDVLSHGEDLRIGQGTFLLMQRLVVCVMLKCGRPFSHMIRRTGSPDVQKWCRIGTSQSPAGGCKYGTGHSCKVGTGQ